MYTPSAITLSKIITTYQADNAIVGTPQHYLNLTSEAAASEFPFVDRDHKIGNFAPYTVAWNLEADRRFSEHLTMRAKYLESHGSGLVNISPPGGSGTKRVCTRRGRNLKISPI
jgi:hypothetical protein